MWVVLFVVIMDIVGIGIIAPMFPFYAMRLGAGPAAVTLCMGLYTAALFFSAPVLGRLSDRFGRKPVMFISLLGSVAGYVLLMRASSLFAVVLSRLIGGISAGNFSAAQAYITDRTSPQERAKFMGYMGAAMGLGYVFGPILGSWLGGNTFENANFVAPALVAAVLCGCAAVCVLFFVEETSTPRRDVVKKGGSSNVLFLPRIVAANITDPSRRSLFYKAVFCSACYQTGAAFYEDIFPIWAADHAIIAGASDMLPMFLASGMMYVVAQTVLVSRVSDHRLVLLWSGVVFMATTYLLTIAANYANPWAVTGLMALIAGCAAMVFTCTQFIISCCADASSRGLILGLASSIGMLGKTIAISVSGFFYAEISHHSPYYAAAICGALLALIAFRLNQKKLRETAAVDVVAQA